MPTFQSEILSLRRVVLRHARDAFVSSARVEHQWRELDYPRAPDLERACGESDAFAELLEGLGVEILWLSGDDLGLDSIYVRDASIQTDRGVVPCRMGKGAREAEPAAHRCFFEGVQPVLMDVQAPDTIEGGDLTWLDQRTVAVGRGYRTSAGAIEQLARALPEVEVITVPLPHWRGPRDVFHLMSMLSPLDEDLLLVYSPLLPVPFREDLLARGYDLVEVPDEEFASQGCNVLAVHPRVVVALDGNPETRRRMEAWGVEVHTYIGREISLPGSGGPTCLTRPLERG